MKLTTKLPLAFAAALLLMFAAALYGLFSLNQSVKVYNTEVRNHVANERAVLTMLATFKLQVQEWKDVLLRGKDPSKLEHGWAAFEQREHTVDEQARALLDTLPEGKSRTLVAQFAAAHTAMGGGYRTGLEAFKSADFDPTAGDRAVAGVDREPARLLAEAQREIAAQSETVSARAAAGARRALVVSMVLMLVALGAGLGGAFMFSRSITRPLNRAIDVAHTVADGNLTSEWHATGNDEVAELLGALKNMQTSLSRVVSTVRRNAEGVAASSSQIAAGNLSLSARTEEQAASLEETAASMSELTATVKQNADHAQQARGLADDASSAAQSSSAVIGRMTGTMSRIDVSSRKIADITGIIDGIAFQTNILALNAAVEAARAGEHGRGFAVVAAEVRALAQHSSSAAKQIGELIADSVSAAADGTGLVTEAEQAMQQVLTTVQRFALVMNEIVAAALEQRTGIEQVDTAISLMDSITQQNAALVEQASAAAQALDQQSQDLARQVAVFSVR